MKLSDFIFSYIKDLGVKDIFMISGGGSMHLVDSVGKMEGLNYICNHHEQASAMAAEAYARVTGKFGVCSVTTGPGGTNTITGVLGAWQDSVPVLFISGQVKRDNMTGNSNVRELGVQEVDIVSIVKSITKYAVTVEDPKMIKYHLEKAIFLAMHGRKGPVWLDIPLDVQSSIIDEKQLEGYIHETDKYFESTDADISKEIKKVVELIKKAKRPVILAGHGIELSGSRDVFLEIATLLGIPVVTTMSATDIIYTDHKLFVGRPGIFGDRSGNFSVQNSDLLISIGARMHLWTIGYDYKTFAREATKIVVDIDKHELKKHTIQPDLAICSDAKNFLLELKKEIINRKLPNFYNWVEVCNRWKKKYPVVLPEYEVERDYVNSYYFTKVLSDLMKDDETIFTGNGTAFTGTIQSIHIKKGQRFHCNVGCASMGYGLPASIGACIAKNKKRIVLITGDGSIMMNLQELQTIRHHNLPIKIFLLNNEGYLAIKNTQDSFFGKPFVATNKESGVSFPDFKRIAKAFDLQHRNIINHDSIEIKIKEVLDMEGPVLCEIHMSPDQKLYPKVTSEKKDDGRLISKPLEDMYPFLEREEFKSNMFIKPINL